MEAAYLQRHIQFLKQTQAFKYLMLLKSISHLRKEWRQSKSTSQLEKTANMLKLSINKFARVAHDASLVIKLPRYRSFEDYVEGSGRFGRRRTNA